MLSVAAIPTDAVLLRPAWSSLLSTLRFAPTSLWRFGNRAAMLHCREGARRRSITDRNAAEGLRFRFDLQHWLAAFARSTGAGREIGILADDGTTVASIQLDRVDASIDEFIWRMIDDGDPRRIADELVARRSRLSHSDALALAGPSVARRLASQSFATALAAAKRAALPLRVCVENSGGSVTWTSNAATVAQERIDVRSGNIVVALPPPDADVWVVSLHDSDTCRSAIECCVPGDHGWIRVDVAAETSAQCDAWRRICATLAEA